MLDPGTRIRHLHFFYRTPCLPPPRPPPHPKFCITFVFYFSWVLHSSQEKLNFCSKNAAALMKFFYGKMRLLFEGSVYFSESWTQNKNCFKYGIITVKPPLQTPHYHGQFALSLGKESPYILSKFNPLNTDTFSGPLKGPINGV